MQNTIHTPESIRTLLKAVKDPEIPVISVVDLGIVKNIAVSETGGVSVDLVPTFAGCPAIEIMANDIRKTCNEAGIEDIQVNIRTNQSWTSDQISDEGRVKLKDFGLSPPPKLGGGELEDFATLEQAQCPKCNSKNTVLRNPFGPTACRAIHHCNDCHETFEQMKPL
ncbi:MAG: 1,2-phenylacetyl-CoA epoxidase subunit PaaD [Bacteroidia bacterium]